MSGETMIEIQALFGTVECQSRIVPTATGYIGEGRLIHRDRAGIVTKTTEWEPTGVVASWVGPDEVRPWWKFWA